MPNNVVVIKQTHAFESKLIPGVTYVLRRKTVARKIQLEMGIAEYDAKVMQVHVDIEADKIRQEKQEKQAAQSTDHAAQAGGGSTEMKGEIVEITQANAALPPRVNGKAHADEDKSTPAATPVSPLFGKRINSWADYSVQREILRRVDIIGITELRPLYLKVYLDRIEGYTTECDDGATREIKTADDLLEYGIEDLVEEILTTMRTTRELGFSLNESEIKNLVLPTFLPAPEVGQQNQTSATGVSKTADTGAETASATSPS